MSNKKDIEEDLSIQTDLETLANSNGGKELLKALTQDIISSMQTMVNKRSIFTLQEYTSTAADIKSRLDIIRILKGAEEKKDMLKNLLEEELLKE
jgi:hypothetical protein